MTNLRAVSLAESESGARKLQAHAPDYGLIIITLALLCIGIVMVYSASLVDSFAKHGDQTYFFQRQLLWCAVGVVVMFLIMRVPYGWWRHVALVALAASLLLLVAVLLPGFGASELGATRWLNVGGLRIGQPSELCKVTLALYMAAWLSGKGQRVKELGYGLLPFAAILGLIVTLVMRQPDMGTALVIVGTAFTIFFVSGASLMHLASVGLIGAGGMAMLAFNSNYRHGRLTAFLDPWAYSDGTGYHVVQSLIALGAGGIRGLGLGDSRQKFGLLPFPYTDSIFAVIGEELGLVGCCVVLGLFLLLAYRGLRTAWRAPDRFGALLAIGISCQMVLQAFLNIAVVTSTVPFTGITLPFVSYGGSSMLVSFAAMGILLNVTQYTTERRAATRLAQDDRDEATLAAVAERRRHWWARLSHARRRPSRPQPALARA